MTFHESSSNRKLKQLARRLEDTQTHFPSRLSPKKSLQDLVDDRLDKLQQQASHYLKQNEQTVTDMKEYISQLNEEVDEMKRYRENSERDFTEIVREKEEEIQGLVKLTNLNTMAIVEQIQMEFRSKENDVLDGMAEEERMAGNALASYQRKAQRMLLSLHNQLQNEKKQRVKSIQELSGRLQQKLDQTNSMIQTQQKVRTETYRKIQQMQQDMSQRLKQDFLRMVRDRKQSNQTMLRMLESACDSILY